MTYVRVVYHLNIILYSDDVDEALRGGAFGAPRPAVPVALGEISVLPIGGRCCSEFRRFPFVLSGRVFRLRVLEFSM